MKKNVAILKGHSLFTDGVVSKLSRLDSQCPFKVIDMCQADPLEAVLREMPEILVVDENDPEYLEKLKGRLFNALPTIKLILLDSNVARFRVVQWSEHNSPQLNDLLGEINPDNHLGIHISEIVLY